MRRRRNNSDGRVRLRRGYAGQAARPYRVFGLWGGWCGFGGLGDAEIADDAGVFPSGGEAGTGFGFAEAQDEAVHLGEEFAHFPELRPEGLGGVN